MKTVGLLGGMSRESTALYYRLINEETRRRLGGLHSARTVLYSVDFHEVEEMQSKLLDTTRIHAEQAVAAALA